MRGRALVVLVLVGSMAAVHAQEESSGNSDCVNELAPCLNYLNDNGNVNRNEPTERCCDPLKQVIEKKGECLCSLMSNEGSAQAEKAGINITLAQQLPALCGQHVNPISCLKTTINPSSSSSSRLFPIFNSLLIPCSWPLLTCLAIFLPLYYY